MNPSPENVLEIYDKEILRRSDFEASLAIYLNELVLHDFEKLVQLLYRIDIDEHKLRYILNEHKDADAGKLMARLVIDRQLEKAAVRETFKNTSQQDWSDC
jgi:hypothetical protein